MNPIAIGKIFSVFGLDGKVKFHSYVDHESLMQFVDHDVLIGQNSEKMIKARMSSVKKSNDHYVVTIDEFNSVDKAQKLSGYTIYVDEKDLPSLKNDEYYFYQLIGSTIYYDDETEVGIVKDIIQTGANDVLVVGDDELLIPVIKDYVLKIDIEKRKIFVKKMEWY